MQVHNEYDFMQVLGEGSFGKVHKAGEQKQAIGFCRRTLSEGPPQTHRHFSCFGLSGGFILAGLAFA